MPVPAAREILRKEVFEILPITVLSLLYEPTFTDLENGDGERFIGMTNGEVMLVRMAESAAQGDKDAFKIILDRVLGKPKQFTEVKKMTMTYQDYLEQVTKNESQTIDAEVAQEREPNEFDL